MARVDPCTIIYAEKRVVFCSHPKITGENALHGNYEENDVLLPNYTNRHIPPPMGHGYPV